MKYAVKSLGDISLYELTHCWNQCWQGYAFNCTYTPEQMRVWLDIGRVSLPASRLLVVEGRIAGFAFLAIDGAQGWLAGTAIAPEFRGYGLFNPLLKTELEIAQRLGLKCIRLEVLAENFAQRIYLSAGFRYLRPLNFYHFERTDLLKTQKLAQGFIRKVHVNDYFTARLHSGFIPAWQRRKSSLIQYPGLNAFLEDNGQMGLLFSGAGNILLDAWSVDSKSAANFGLFFSRIDGKTLRNQPVDALADFLNSVSQKPYAVQHEMAIDF